MYPDIDFKELKQMVIGHFDETSLLDALDIDMGQLVDILTDQVEEYRNKLIYMMQC